MGGGFRLHSIMHKDELPALYQDLADLRIAQHISRGTHVADFRGFRFIWVDTPEEFEWWLAVSASSDVQDLPPIPESSIQELLDHNMPSTTLDPMNLITDYSGDPLPEPYQSLAQERRAEYNHQHQPIPSICNRLQHAFNWSATEEEHRWWGMVNQGFSPAIIAHSPTPAKEEKPEPKKHSTMEDVFVGMNRHAKKENSKEDSTKEDKELIDELEAVPSERIQEPAGPE